ncbi:MAG: hypothetical protein JNM56_20455, partial [Planctomycetia bacterium]|nr:hypothetical protein [Planctomycetia bacterium]
DVLQFKLRADPFAHESAAKKQDELKLAERDLAELKKHLETIKELLKDQEAGKQATAAIEAMLKRKAAEVADRRAELARLEKEGPKPVVRAFGPDDAVAFAKLKAREAELHASTVQLDAAKARLERFRQLRERKLVSDDEVKTAEVDVARFEAELQAKKADLLATQARTKPAAPAATPTAPRPPDKPAGSDQRIAELEKRLELLLREVQGLRQDLGNKPTPKPSNR